MDCTFARGKDRQRVGVGTMFYRVLLWRHKGKKSKHPFQQGSFFGRRLQGEFPGFWAPSCFYLPVNPPLACFQIRLFIFLYYNQKYFGYVCRNKVLLCSPGCSGTCYVAYLAGLKLTLLMPHNLFRTGIITGCSHHTGILLLFPLRAQRCGRALTLSTLLF